MQHLKETLACHLYESGTSEDFYRAFVLEEDCPALNPEHKLVIAFLDKLIELVPPLVFNPDNKAIGATGRFSILPAEGWKNYNLYFTDAADLHHTTECPSFQEAVDTANARNLHEVAMIWEPKNGTQ